MNISEAFIVGLIGKSQSLPDNVMLQARKVLLDYLGVLAGGKRYIKEKHPELINGAPNSTLEHKL